MWLLELGLEPYQRAWDLQHRIAEARQRDSIPDVLILLEHEPVITLGRRADEGNVLVTPQVLSEAGIEMYRVERGGDVTYHGPGQLVGYPIMRIADYGLGVGDYMHLLEEVMVRTLSDFGLVGTRRENIIGVWVGNNKVAAFGARLQHGVTYHGFALNVAPNMQHFDLIVPCGITDGGVTSIERELGRSVSMTRTRERVRHWFSELFQVSLESMQLEELGYAVAGDALTEAH